MKIAMIIERMDPSGGGRETSTAQVAAALAGRGHDVTVICQRGSWRGEGVELRRLGSRGLLRIDRLRNFVADVRKQIGLERFDIVHATLPIPGANVYQPRGGTIVGQTAASRRKRGLFGPVHAILFERFNACRRYLGRLERQVVADQRTACLAVSEMVAREFRNGLGRADNLHVVYNAVDIPQAGAELRADWRAELREKLRISESGLVFVTAATNFALKGVDHAIRALGKWCSRRKFAVDAHLVMIGSETPQDYHRIAGGYQVADRVTFVKPTDEMFKWYSAADVCILLSWYDPCSRVVLEAVRWGLPAITTAYNGAAEVLAQGAGVVIDSPKDKFAIVAAMNELTDPQTRGPYVQACSRLGDSLSIERHTDELLEVYAEVAK